MSVRLISYLTSAALCLMPIVSRAQDASSEDLSAAGARGLKSKRQEFAYAETGIWMSFGKGFKVTVTGPLNRANNAAAEAGRRYLPWTTDSLDTAAKSSVIIVHAAPKAVVVMNGKTQVTSPATHLVVRARDKSSKDSAPVQPDSVQLFPAEWSNALGGQFSSTGIRAFFAPGKLPAGEYDVLIITDEKEYSATIIKPEAAKVR